MKSLTHIINYEQRTRFSVRKILEGHVKKSIVLIIFDKLYWQSDGFHKNLLDSVIWNATRTYPVGSLAHNINSTIGKI